MDKNQEVTAWVEERFSKGAARLNLIGVLLAMQKEFGYLPKTGMKLVALKYPVKVCMGTACHIKQGRLVLDHFERKLGILEGEVTQDQDYSLDRVACVGCCTLAPVALIGEEVIGEMSPTKVDGLLLQHQLAEEE
jgi:NADH:ubiquinone oxidoreductase subunit E